MDCSNSPQVVQLFCHSRKEVFCDLLATGLQPHSQVGMGMRLAVYIECIAMDMFGIVVVKTRKVE